MTPDGIKEKFELYRKWLKSLLVKEFINLPVKHQENFLALINNFVADCLKIMEEGKEIKEQIIKVEVTKIEIPDNKEENFIVYGKTEKSNDDIKMRLPIDSPRPKLGAILYHTMFSLNGEVWYSSKEELITKGAPR